MNEREIVFIEPVVFVRRHTVPVGFLKKVGKFLKRQVNSIKKRIKPILGVVASIALPGVGGLIVNGAMTAADVAKAKKERDKLKKAAAAAAKADAEAIRQIKEGYARFKAESDAFRKTRNLPPLPSTLPVDLTKATPEEVERAFVVLQDDAAAILAREQEQWAAISASGNTVTSAQGATVPGAPRPSIATTDNFIIIGAAVLVVAFAASRTTRKSRK
jgi:hypothetical protein